MQSEKSMKKVLAALVCVGAGFVFGELPVGDAEWLMDAVTNTTENTTVVVPKGEYKITSTLISKKSGVSVSLIGKTGNPADVVIDGQGLVRCIVARTGATVSGMTVRNGNVVAPPGNGGAGIHANAALVTNCIIEGCHLDITGTGSGGGGVFANSGSRIVDCIFSNNVVNINQKSYSGGGAVSVYDLHSIISGCTFINNSITNAPGYLSGGGGVFFFSTGCVVRASSFIGNTATYGGGLYGLPRLIENCVFTNNTGKSIGSAIYFHKANISDHTNIVLRVKGSSFIGNTSYRSVIIVREKEQFALEDCLFDANVNIGTSNNGAGYLFDKDVSYAVWNNIMSISNCVFRNHSITNMGAWSGFWSHSDYPPIVYNTTFENNRIDRQDKHLIPLGNNGIIDSCRFIGNRFNVRGGQNNTSCIRVSGTNAHIRNCLFVTNICSQSKAVVVAQSSENNWAVIDNCTFAHNVQVSTLQGTYGGMIYMTSNSVVRNCLFYKNTDNARRSVYFNADMTRLKENKIFNCCDANYLNQLNEENDCIVTNAGDIASWFASSDPITSYDYRLARKSPLVDGGMALDWIVAKKTLDITCEKRNYRLEGNAVDIGAWEYRPFPGLYIMLK